MPNIKWCLISKIPKTLSKGYITLLKRISLERPRYAFFIGFDYANQWEHVNTILEHLKIDINNTFFAIRSNGSLTVAQQDFIKGRFDEISEHTNNEPLSNDDLVKALGLSSDYFSLMDKKIGRSISNDNLHHLISTASDDALVLHVNTTLTNGMYCLVNAEQLEELITSHQSRDQIILAFGCEDLERFMAKDQFISFCQLYDCIYMCSSDKTQKKRYGDGRNVWKIGSSLNEDSLCLCCISTEPKYKYIIRYSKSNDDSFVWTRTATSKVETETAEDDPADPNAHYGKEFLFINNDKEVDDLPNIALKELENALAAFLLSEADMQSWIIRTYPYKNPIPRYKVLINTIKYYIEQIVSDKYKEWTCLNYRDQFSPHTIHTDTNILLICHIADYSKCLSAAKQIAWITVKENKKHIRIIVIYDDGTISEPQIEPSVYFPLDLCHELTPPDWPISAKKRIDPTKGDRNFADQICLLFWQHIGSSKSKSYQNNTLKYSSLNVLTYILDMPTLHESIKQNPEVWKEILTTIYESIKTGEEQKRIERGDETHGP